MRVISLATTILPCAVRVRRRRLGGVLCTAIFAQETSEVFCTDGDWSCWTVVVVIGLLLFGVYLLVSRTRRRSEQDYWKRRQWEQDLRSNDPDMAPPPDDE
jgi:hypothetical protein